jgi:hypothetical protein
MTTEHRKTQPTAGRPHRGVALLAFVGCGLLVLFWASYFSGLLEFGTDDPVMTEFEAAFPFADAMLAVTLLVAGTGLWTGRRRGRFFMTAGSAMALYLGILDLTFYSRQGLYTPLGSEGAVELALNLVCIVGGLVGLAFCWKLGRRTS